MWKLHQKHYIFLYNCTCVTKGSLHQVIPKYQYIQKWWISKFLVCMQTVCMSINYVFLITQTLMFLTYDLVKWDIINSNITIKWFTSCCFEYQTRFANNSFQYCVMVWHNINLCELPDKIILLFFWCINLCQWNWNTRSIDNTNLNQLYIQKTMTETQTQFYYTNLNNYTGSKFRTQLR